MLTEWERPDDFHCTNGLYVTGGVKCDTYNNCGDMSDESEQLCHGTNESSKDLGLIVVGVGLGVSLVGNIICIYMLCKKVS